jgi:hypothetical protein
MAEEQKTEAQAPEQEKQGPRIHRVCIQCNNMFTVPLEKIEIKHCPNCHKG